MRSVQSAFLALTLCVLSTHTLCAQEKMKPASKQQKSSTNQATSDEAPPTSNGEKAKAISKSESSSPNTKPPFVGRLPRYFSKVVSPEQRETIYEIQYSFRAKLERLQEELTALKNEQSQAVEAVLSKVQMEQVTMLRNQSQASRAKVPADTQDSQTSSQAESKTASRPAAQKQRNSSNQ